MTLERLFQSFDAEVRWSGYQGNEAPTGVSEPSVSRTSALSAGTLTGTPDDDDGKIAVVEEKLRVGKRNVGQGRVRVRSYVVETPVEENVSLRAETVHLERTPVDRVVEAGDAFVDRTIEAAETAEEAVVSKEARVTEEISLGKTADTRTETVRDTVRHTEVEVQDERLQRDK